MNEQSPQSLRNGRRWAPPRRVATLILIAFALSGCDKLLPHRKDMTLPPVAAVQAIYARHGTQAHFSFDGSVLVLTVRQSLDQLRRGGTLWARVGPYVYLFSPGTQDALKKYPGIAAVRVITELPGGTEIGRATMARDALSDLLWRRALNLLGHALQEGTHNPKRLDDLVRWGEEHTTYRYNPAYVQH